MRPQSMFVTVKTEFWGAHRWPDAPDAQSWLRNRHVHHFLVDASAEVTDPDRSIEFFVLRQKVDEAVQDLRGAVQKQKASKSLIPPGIRDDVFDMGTMSCEHIARGILNRVPCLCQVTVSEDGGDSGTVAAYVRDGLPVNPIDDLPESPTLPTRPPIVTICGSTRFKDETIKAIAEGELRGWAVWSVGSFMHADKEPISDETKRALDILHKQKIAYSDAIYVVNPGGYVGASTRSEIEYAKRLGKAIFWLVLPDIEGASDASATA